MTTVSVLIAEDEATVRRALSDLVGSEEGLELAGLACDADEAMALIEQRRPDVALVDFKMPAGGGPRVAREVTRSFPGTRVVALSAYEDRNSVFQMLRAGAVGYLVKGAPLTEIVDTIRRAARGQAVLSAEVTSDVVHELAGKLELEEGSKELRRAQVERIRAALDAGILSVVFQPIVELENGAVIGYEALARFETMPSRPPNLWFAEAGTVGLQVELELAALRAALDGLSEIRGDLFLSVNLSPDALLSSSVLEALHANPTQTVVEITEHAQIEDYEVLNHSLLELRAAGLRLAIDDAGAGYSSFRHIIEIAADIIKIDGSLTRRIETERGRRAFASALISFAREMNQLVVAEGIENEAAVTALTALGVRYGQGFHLGLPGKAGETRLPGTGETQLLP
jgi:EAL domain-containing protein (putative c-di-GMP-specific phosphodiesterase class I)/DNA-binding NarL/FixJ family response regulator